MRDRLENTGTVAGTKARIVERRLAGLEAVRARFGNETLRVTPNRHGLPKQMFRENGHLTQPSGRLPEEIALQFLRENQPLFPFRPSELDGLRLAVKDASNGATFLAFVQTLEGVDVFNGQVKFTLNKAGQIVQVSSGDLVPDLEMTGVSRLTAEQAARAAFPLVGAARPGSLTAVTRPNVDAAFENPSGDGLSPITAGLVVFPMNAASARLAYRVFLEVDSEHFYEVVVDAENGALLFRHRLNLFEAKANVWTQAPSRTATRQLVTFPEGWLPATATVTTGNNADAYLDINGDDKPDAITSSTLTDGRATNASQRFDFEHGDGLFGLDPRRYQAAAVTNLFYYVNIAHDFYYGLGFTETAGNFQTDNLGRGGMGGDAVVAAAQQGRTRNNASFVPTPDGTPPRMRMGLFTRDTIALTDDLDSAYDGQTVIHEYGHGVSNRLVGARTSTSCLSGIQSGALGEGWSDYFASSFYNNPVVGAYLAQDTSKGIRRQSYEGYTFTYADIGAGSRGYEVHDDGEIWAAALWDLRKSLGQAKTDLLVINGLKATPCNPSMVDARDAILAADQAANAGANRAQIWSVFAKHGMGYSASGADGSGQTGTYYNAAFDQPPDIQATLSPQITSNPLIAVGAGDRYSYKVTATNPAGGTLAYALTSGPAGMAVDAAGLTTWTTGFLAKRVKITVTDGKGGNIIHGFLVPVQTKLTAGTSLVVTGSQGDAGYALIDVPAGTPVLQVTLREGTGDADLLLMDPTGALFGASTRPATNETLSASNPSAGTWLIMVNGYRDFSSVALTANLITPRVLNNFNLNGLAGTAGSETFFRLTKTAPFTDYVISTTGGTGDVDLFVKLGSPAACNLDIFVLEPCVRDAESARDGNDEQIVINSVGDYYIDLVGFTDYSGVKLSVTAVFGVGPISLSPTSLTYAAVEGGATPPTQNLDIIITSPNGSWAAEAVTSSGGNWLTFASASGTNAIVTVIANQAGLRAGTYQGNVTVTFKREDGSFSFLRTIPVTLTVTPRPVLTASGTALAFQTVTGLNPAPQNLASIGGGALLNWTTFASVTWLKLTPANGSGNATIQASANAATLPAGSYSGSVTITAPGATNSPLVIPVTLNVVLPGPSITAGGIVGAGNSSPPVLQVSPGALATAYGVRFAPPGTVRPVVATDLVNGVLPTKLAGTCVMVDGTPAFLLFVSPGQVNFQVPTLAVGRQVDVAVVTDCGGPSQQSSPALKVTVQQASPEFLYWQNSASGPSPLCAVNAISGAFVGPPGLIAGVTFVPAKPGDILTVYGIGFGPTSPTVASGQGSTGAASTVATPQVTIGSVSLAASDILYAGAAPGFAGLYQLNIRIPALPDGVHAVQLSLDSFKTPLGSLTVANQ